MTKPDDVWTVLYLEPILRDQGFDSFAIATTEEEAIAAAQARRPDLVTADVRLNPGNGVSAVRTICADQPVPVIYVTGNPDELQGVPADIIVEKPFTGAMVGRAVQAARALGAGWLPR